jgi:hypothetical protein
MILGGRKFKPVLDDDGDEEGKEGEDEEKAELIYADTGYTRGPK